MIGEEVTAVVVVDGGDAYCVWIFFFFKELNKKNKRCNSNRLVGVLNWINLKIREINWTKVKLEDWIEF